jgi:hypothetical protein
LLAPLAVGSTPARSNSHLSNTPQYQLKVASCYVLQWNWLDAERRQGSCLLTQTRSVRMVVAGASVAVEPVPSGPAYVPSAEILKAAMTLRRRNPISLAGSTTPALPGFHYR